MIVNAIIRIRFIVKYAYTHMEFVLVTEPSSAQSEWQQLRHR